jgi:hypothetical protein
VVEVLDSILTTEKKKILWNGRLISTVKIHLFSVFEYKLKADSNCIRPHSGKRI